MSWPSLPVVEVIGLEVLDPSNRKGPGAWLSARASHQLKSVLKDH